MEIEKTISTDRTPPERNRNIPPEILACMDRVTTIYRLCERFPDLRANLNAKVVEAINQTIDNLLVRLSTKHLFALQKDNMKK